MNNYRVIAGSSRKEFQKSDKTRPVRDAERMRVTVVVSPDSDVRHVAALARAADEYGLRLVKTAGHSIDLSGPALNMQRAFQVSLSEHTGPAGQRYRCRKGPYSVPTTFGSNVVAVLGLDTRRQASPRFHARADYRELSSRAVSFDARTIANAYGFPPNAGRGHSVGIIELGGAYQADEMTAYFRQVGLKIRPRVSIVGKMRPRQTSASVEVMLDAEIVASVVPLAKTVIYFGPNTTAGFYNAIRQAVTAGHDAISISWGAPEEDWTPAAMQAYNNLAKAAGENGVTITAASGDAGSGDGGSPGTNVDFPAAAPYILGCGGTSLTLANGEYGSEVVWNNGSGATGGGLSEVFNTPAYQEPIAGQNIMRMVPDVAADADPLAGYLIRVNNRSMVIGGTSAAAPLWAALVCKLNAALGRRLGFLHPTLYGLPADSLRPVTVGNNGAYIAGPGYDMCTGLGTPSQTLTDLLK